ncbi:ABC transporter substrate-binding protein [Noviherbaspirillum sedimenti]|uniref:ABC transporter substrate-binding protein n=1 Tax=Noviherbaspirillum sedimenti TaxID=2320865 RepID=A0A3A3G396_9BURK|nr:ABC transporter substrate-binding protein [Noviherbaspirillum sedimenti]RJG02947.1 ABC transporter substrate-binding protein [Noviherbaspirillum sedimenti]
MKRSSLPLAVLALCVSTAVITPAIAQNASDTFKIAAMVDMTGPYSALAGPGVVTGMKMAIEDFGGKVLGKPIEILSADSLGKVDVAAARVREWYDRDGVNMVLESADSATAVAMQKLAAEKKKVTFLTSGTTAVTNSECTPYGIQYAWNTYALAHGTGRAVMKEGGDSWYFLSADYTFGKSLEAETTAVVQKTGGKVLGSSRHPLGAPDFASFLLSAQASKAKVIALANAGRDTQNAIRQAREFGLTGGNSRVVPLILFDSDVKGMGLDLAQGLAFTTAFYWDQNDATRAWSNRFFKLRNAMPTMNQAAAYSATMHYLNAVKSVGSAQPDAVMAHMKKTTISDMFTKSGKIRDDGLMVHDMFLAEVKKPSESKGPWDLLSIKQVIPGELAFQPLNESTCPLLKK